MKKIIILSILVISVLLIASSVAMAGGWSTVDTATTALTPDQGSWSVADDGAPHGGFSTATNRCRVCHAVHMADPSTAPTVPGRINGPISWRLLRNQNRTEECYYCHGPNGATDKQPFRDRAGVTFRGEHTLGSTVLPDANTTTVPGGQLTCGTCHNVHAADVVAGSFSGSVETSMAAFMAARILKNSPNPFNSQKVSTDTGAVAGAGGADPFTKFCSDCHDKNPNWDVDLSGSDETNSADLRRDSNNATNTTSHVQGLADNGLLEVYGETKKVANYTTAEGNPYYANIWGYKEVGDFNTYFKDTTLTASARWGCRGCHRASDRGNIDQTFAGSAFPHRTVGSKLLFDDFATGTIQLNDGGTQNDATRVLPTMDNVCAKCHRNNGVPDGVSTQGVGVTF